MCFLQLLSLKWIQARLQGVPTGREQIPKYPPKFTSQSAGIDPISRDSNSRFSLIKLIQKNQIPLWIMPRSSKLARLRAYQGNDRESSLLCQN
jgi:hypothetical protein